MKTHLFYLSILLATLFFTACNNQKEADKIIGKWERFDDHAAGSILVVKKTGTNYEASLEHISGVLSDYGFEIGDIKWRNITHIENNQYTGEDLLKSVDRTGEIVQTRYDAVGLSLVASDILQLKGLEEGEESIGTNQRWRRLK